MKLIKKNNSDFRFAVQIIALTVVSLLAALFV